MKSLDQLWVESPSEDLKVHCSSWKYVHYITILARTPQGEYLGFDDGGYAYIVFPHRAAQVIWNLTNSEK